MKINDRLVGQYKGRPEFQAFLYQLKNFQSNFRGRKCDYRTLHTFEKLDDYNEAFLIALNFKTDNYKFGCRIGVYEIEEGHIENCFWLEWKQIKFTVKLKTQTHENQNSKTTIHSGDPGL
jgi:hypothetical protein